MTRSLWNSSNKKRAAGCSRGHFSFAKGEVVREDQWEWPAVVDAEAFRMKKQARRRWGHFRSTGPSAAILLGLALCSHSFETSAAGRNAFLEPVQWAGSPPYSSESRGCQRVRTPPSEPSPRARPRSLAVQAAGDGAPERSRGQRFPPSGESEEMPGIKTGSSLHRMISNPRATPWGKVLTQLLQSTMEKDPRPEVVLAVVERCLKNFNALHCALVLSRVSRLTDDLVKGYAKDPRWSLMMKKVLEYMPEASPRDVAQTANSLARLKGRVRLPEGLMQALQARASVVWEQMNPQELSLIVNGFANLPEQPPASYWEVYEELVLDLVQQGQFGTQGLSMILNGFSKLGYAPSDHFLDVFEAAVLKVLSMCNTQEYANVVNAFGKLDHQPSEAFLRAFVDITAPRLRLFKPQELAMTLNALSKMRFRPDDAYLEQVERQAILFCLPTSSPRFKPQESSIVVNAFTKFTGYEVRDPAFFTATERFAVAHLQGYYAQEVANTIHGLGRLGHNPSTEFCDAFVEHARRIFAASSMTDRLGYRQQPTTGRRFERFKPQELANLINGLAKFSYRPSRDFMLDYLAAVQQYEMSGFSPQELANIMNGLMRLNHRADDSFFEAVVINMAGRMRSFNGQEIGMTLHSLGRMLYYPGDRFMAQAARHYLDGVASSQFCTMQSAAMMLNSFARLGYLPSEDVLLGLDAIVERAIDERQCRGSEIAQALNAMAHLNHVPSRTFMRKVKDMILETRESLDLSTIAMLLWSFSVIGVSGIKLFMTEMVTLACQRLEGEEPRGLDEGSRELLVASAAAAAMENGDIPLIRPWSTVASSDLSTSFGLATLGDETMEPAVVMCMRQLMLTRRFIRTMKSKPPEAVLKRFDALVDAEWAIVNQAKFEPNPSKLHQDVVNVLARELRLDCDIEVEDDGYVLDIVVKPSRPGLLPVVLEVDGPHHFFRNEPRCPMGFTRFKHNMLTACKRQWAAVASVSQLEWMGCKDSAAKADLLRAKLKGSSVSLPPARPPPAAAQAREAAVAAALKTTNL